MIIKTFSRTNSHMQDIVNYIADKDKADEHPLRLYRNVPAIDTTAIAEAFEANLNFQTAQNKIAAYHNILSFHPYDVPRLNQDIIRALVQRYIQLRAPESIWFGQLHTDQVHPHVHLLLSGNAYRSRKASRISRPVFYQLRIDLEQYQQECFPELIHSLQYEKMRNYPLHLLYSRLHPVYEQATTKEAFWDRAQTVLQGKAQVLPDKQQILYLNRLYTPAEVGLDLHIFDRLQALEQIRRRSPTRHHSLDIDR
jgi:hypothetical protein